MQDKVSKGGRPSRSAARVGLLLGVPLAVLAGAQAVGWAAAQIKTWADGDTLTAKDLNDNFAALQTAITGVHASTPGATPQNAGASCSALRAAGITMSGTYWVVNPAPTDASQATKPVLVYCDQITNGGGWALVQNSVMGPFTLDFWNIPYASRATRRGRPSIDSNFYDGSLYQTAAASYMDVFEDWMGTSAVAMTATSDGISNVNMRFSNPVKVSGSESIYQRHFAAGWSAPDYDGDTYAAGNCAAQYNNVTQHYADCWVASLGSDPDDIAGGDGHVGPHLNRADAAALGLGNDGTEYTRLRRWSRFVKW